MRVKLFCDWSLANKQIFTNKDVCSWIYGVQRKQVREIVITLKTKEERIIENLNNSWTFIKRECMYKVNP